MTMRKPTEAEKRAFVEGVVDTAIVQSAESSGLRKWLIERSLKCFTGWQEANAADVLLHMHDDLIDAFEDIIDPDEMPDEPFSLSKLEYDDPPTPWMHNDD